MTIWKQCVRAGVLVVCLAAAEHAQADTPRFEIQPFGGYRIGGDFDLEDDKGVELGRVDLDDDVSWGLGVAVYRDPDAYYEVLYSRQATQLEESDPAVGGVDVTIEYAHVGGTLIFDYKPWLRPYLSLTLGLTRIDLEDSGSEYEPSGSLGVGVRVPVGERIAFLFGTRGFGTLVGSDTRFSCASVGGEATCIVGSSGDVLLQWEATMGVAFTF